MNVCATQGTSGELALRGPTPTASPSRCGSTTSRSRTRCEQQVGRHRAHGPSSGNSPRSWQDAFSLRMMELLAWLVSDICRRHALPLEFVPSAGLLADAPGITTHAEVSRAWQKSDHWDPGPHFPTAWLIERSAHYSRLTQRQEPTPAPPPPPI